MFGTGMMQEYESDTGSQRKNTKPEGLSKDEIISSQFLGIKKQGKKIPTLATFTIKENEFDEDDVTTSESETETPTKRVSSRFDISSSEEEEDRQYSSSSSSKKSYSRSQSKKSQSTSSFSQQTLNARNEKTSQLPSLIESNFFKQTIGSSSSLSPESYEKNLMSMKTNKQCALLCNEFESLNLKQKMSFVSEIKELNRLLKNSSSSESLKNFIKKSSHIKGEVFTKLSQPVTSNNYKIHILEVSKFTSSDVV